MKPISTHRYMLVLACVLGACAGRVLADAPNVLLLGDAGSEGQVMQALRSADHNVIYGGLYYEWDGVDPDIDAFDVVVYLDGYEYGNEMLPAAEAALSTFVAAGGGLVITEWSAYDDYSESLSPGVSALMPVTSPEGDYDYGNDWIVTVDPAHLLSAWLPDQWWDAAGFSYVVAHESATVAIEDTGGNPMLTYRTDTGGTVIHVNHELTYTTERISRNALQVLVNAVEFAYSPTPPDCNINEVADHLDVANGDSTDVNNNHVPDECDPDCNGNNLPDDLDVRPGSGFSQVPFEFDVTTPAEWNYVNSCDDCTTDEIALPFPVTLGGETLTQFALRSDGYVELFRAGETKHNPGYSSVRDLINYSTPPHTYLMAAYDDLDSGYVGGYGYRTEPSRITFYWETQTNEDADGVYMGVSIFQIVLDSDGTIQWNFASEGIGAYGYDLFTGVYFGYGANQLYELISGVIPEVQSWQYVGPIPPYSEDVNYNGVPDECDPDCNGNDLPDDLDIAPPIDPGITQVTFRFIPPGFLAWSDTCDTCESGPVSLPFPVTLGSDTYVAFQQTSDGYVELLREGESPYGFSYGYMADLIAYTGGDPDSPRHTFLMTAFDDLDSEYNGVFGYELEDAQVVFYWYTETYEDDDDGRHNEFEMILSDDFSVRWNFNSAYYSGYDYDLFTGVYLGHNDQTLYEVMREVIPNQESWVFTETGLPGGDSEDADENGIPDECEGRGDMNDDGLVNVADLSGFVTCLQGPDIVVGLECQRADFDYDSDVDLEDVAAFCESF